MKVIRTVDPQGSDAMLLLREAAIEARALYSDLLSGEVVSPTNSRTPERGVYLVGYSGETAVACGAFRPLGQSVAEVRRMFLSKSHRRQGWAREMLRALEEAGSNLAYETLRLETGNRQTAAMSLYAAYGFNQIEPYGEYVNDPTSVCYEKRIRKPSAA